MINFAGDVSLTDGYFNIGFGIGYGIAKGKNPFATIGKNENDIWVGNFEGVISNHSCNKGYARKVFRISPDVFTLQSIFDIYGFANNHAMQHGTAAYWDTVRFLKEKGCGVFGFQNEKSVCLHYKDRDICITGVSFRIDEFSENPCYWHCPEYKEVQEALEELPENAFKVLFVHWGHEYICRPSSTQKKFAHWLIDAGFNLIIGMHPHVLQGYEDYNNGRIYYSLGNFIFDMPSEACRFGALVELDFAANGAPIFMERYVHIDSKGYPSIVDESNVPEKYHFDFLNKEIKKEDNLEQYHNAIRKGYLKYRIANRRTIMKNIFFHPFQMFEIIFDFIQRKI